jgi:cysteinyl-tRNA synthetase
MSKSLGNIILVKDLAEDFEGEVIRLALLSSHYRQGLDWNNQVAYQSKKLLDKLYSIYQDLADIKINPNEGLPDEVRDSLFDDLNTPLAITYLNKLVKDYKNITADQKSSFKSKLLLVSSLLGILQSDPSLWFKEDIDSLSIDSNNVEMLIAERMAAKEIKDFVKADQIRDELESMGVILKDTSSGSEWSLKK